MNKKKPPKQKKAKVEIEKILDVKTAVKNPICFPWPYEDNYFSKINVVEVMEYIPGKLRGQFMDEIWRVLHPDGVASILVPYWNSALAVQDYLLEWPAFREQSFLLFNKPWRDSNNRTHDLKCDFNFSYGYAFTKETALRADDARPFFIQYYNNTIDALQITLNKMTPEKRKQEEQQQQKSV